MYTERTRALTSKEKNKPVMSPSTPQYYFMSAESTLLGVLFFKVVTVEFSFT